ncbi:MAG: hypothetical protein HY335_00355 [Deinococcus sp.]|nr:hypothetical protein [Deinococcus sp.]
MARRQIAWWLGVALLAVAVAQGTGSPPAVTSAELGDLPGDETQVRGLVRFTDPDADVVRADFSLVASQTGIIFPPFAITTIRQVAEGQISFFLGISSQSSQPVTFQVVLTDAAGNVSAPFQFAAQVVAPEAVQIPVSVPSPMVVAARIALSGVPVGLVLTPSGAALVTLADRGQLVQVDLASGQSTTVATGLGNPVGVAVAGAVAVVAERATGRLSSVDLATGTTTTLVQDLAGPVGVAALPDGSRVVVTESTSGQLAVVSLSDGTRQVIAEGLASPAAVAVRGNTALVSTALGLVQVDLSAGTVTTLAADAPLASGVAVANGTVLLSVSGQGVVKVDLATGAVTPGAGGPAVAGGLAVTREGTVLFLDAGESALLSLTL